MTRHEVELLAGRIHFSTFIEKTSTHGKVLGPILSSFKIVRYHGPFEKHFSELESNMRQKTAITI